MPSPSEEVLPNTNGISVSREFSKVAWYKRITPQLTLLDDFKGDLLFNVRE